MRTRKAEIEQIVSLLEQPHEDVESLAEEVWKLVDNLRREREVWVIGADHHRMGQFIYGVYESQATAEKDLTKFGNVASYSPTEDRFRLFKVRSSSSLNGFNEPLDYK